MSATEWLGYAEVEQRAGLGEERCDAPGRSLRPSVLPRPTMAPPRPARRKPAGKKVPRTDRGQHRAPIAALATAPAQRTTPDEQRTAELMTAYAPVVRQIVGGFQRKLPRNVLRDDLIAAGTAGLWDAIRRHGDKPDEGFDWYVRVRIRGAILDELRAQDWLPRRMRAVEVSEQGAPAVVRFDDVSDWEQSKSLAVASSSEDLIERKIVSASLVRAVEQLPERERHIVASHYFEGRKFKDLGAELGVSEPRISQLHARAMARLRDIMAAA